MAQARIALSRAGISTTAIEALLDAMPLGQAKVEARIWWEQQHCAAGPRGGERARPGAGSRQRGARRALHGGGRHQGS